LGVDWWLSDFQRCIKLPVTQRSGKHRIALKVAPRADAALSALEQPQSSIKSTSGK